MEEHGLWFQSRALVMSRGRASGDPIRLPLTITLLSVPYQMAKL